MLHRKKFSASLTRRLSARSPTTVPRGLGSSSDMIAGIWSPLSIATALYFPSIRGKCLSIASRGTTGQKKTGPDFSEARSLHGARGTSARAAIHDSFHFLEGWFDVGDRGAVLGFNSHAGSPSLRSVIAEAPQRPSQQEPSSAARSRDSGTGSPPRRA